MSRPAMRHAAAVLVAGAVLAGCAGGGSLNLGAAPMPKIGETRDAVLARWGTPRGLYDVPDGGRRLIYTNEPVANRTDVFDFDANDRLVRTEQTRTRERFEAAGKEGWHRAEVQRTFGLPAGRDQVERAEPARWAYRFLDNQYLRVAVLHFGTAGAVVRTEILDDTDRSDGRYR